MPLTNITGIARSEGDPRVERKGPSSMTGADRLARALLGCPKAGIYAYSHAFGGYAGSHADYVRVPFADTDCFHVPDGVSDQDALFIPDAAPTGFMGADFCHPTRRRDRCPGSAAASA